MELIFYSLILVIGMLASIYTGFYFGYLKREKEPPDYNIIDSIMGRLDNRFDVKEAKQKKKEPEPEQKGFYE